MLVTDLLSPKEVERVGTREGKKSPWRMMGECAGDVPKWGGWEGEFWAFDITKIPSTTHIREVTPHHLSYDATDIERR